jgi:hypothetical protein
MGDDELELLLALDGAAFEIAPGVVVEFAVRCTDVTRERPHGISYALVLRRKGGGAPWVRFDNAHGLDPGRRGYRRRLPVFDHWHRTEKDPGRPYDFSTAARLLDDFWTEVRRALDAKGIAHDL